MSKHVFGSGRSSFSLRGFSLDFGCGLQANPRDDFANLAKTSGALSALRGAWSRAYDFVDAVCQKECV